MYSSIETKSDAHKLLSLASLAGVIILENGGEVYRAEDTIIRICDSKVNITKVDSFSTPNVVFVSFNYKGDILTNLKRVKNPSINLQKIERVNEFSRNFVNNTMALDEAYKYLNELYDKANLDIKTKILTGMIASTAISFLFDGGIREALATLLASFFMLLISENFKKLKLTFFIDTFVAAACATIFALITISLNISDNIDTVVISSIMCLVPGVPIANSMRDTLSGDFVSGLTRLMEAVVIAVAIALGVGTVLNIYLKGLV